MALTLTSFRERGGGGKSTGIYNLRCASLLKIRSTAGAFHSYNTHSQRPRRTLSCVLGAAPFPLHFQNPKDIFPESKPHWVQLDLFLKGPAQSGCGRAPSLGFQDRGMVVVASAQRHRRNYLAPTDPVPEAQLPEPSQPCSTRQEQTPD